MLANFSLQPFWVREFLLAIWIMTWDLEPYRWWGKMIQCEGSACFTLWLWHCAVLWWANLLDTDWRCCYVSSVSTSVCILWSGWLVSSTSSSFVDYTFTLISAYKTLTLCFCVCLSLSVVFPNCSQNPQSQGNDDHSLERSCFQLISKVQHCHFLWKCGLWALVLYSTASIAFVLTFFWLDHTPSLQCKLNRWHWSCVIALYYSQHILTYRSCTIFFSHNYYEVLPTCVHPPDSLKALIVDSSVFSLLLLVEAVWFSSAKVIYRSKCDQMWLTWLPCRYTWRWKAHASCWWVMSFAVFHIKLLHCFPSYMYLLTSLGHTICFSHAWFTSLDNLDHTFCAELSPMEVEDVQFKQVVSSVDSPLLCFEFHYAAIWFWRMSVPVSIY
jgi:hypothetical protein